MNCPKKANGKLVISTPDFLESNQPAEQALECSPWRGSASLGSQATKLDKPA